MAQNPSPSLLDAGQIIRRVYNEADDNIRVNASISMDGVTQEVAIDHTDDSIKIGDGTNLASVNNDGSIKVSTGLIKARFDNVTGDHTDTTSEYTYKMGVTVVGTVTITYTDDTKTQISTLVVS